MRNVSKSTNSSVPRTTGDVFGEMCDAFAVSVPTLLRLLARLPEEAQPTLVACRKLWFPQHVEALRQALADRASRNRKGRVEGKEKAVKKSKG